MPPTNRGNVQTKSDSLLAQKQAKAMVHHQNRENEDGTAQKMAGLRATNNQSPKDDSAFFLGGLFINQMAQNDQFTLLFDVFY